MRLTKRQLRRLILNELAQMPSYTYYDMGVDNIPDKTDAHDDIVGHT